MAAEAEVVMVARVVRLDRVGQGPGMATLRGSVERQPGQVVDAAVTATLSPHLYDIAVVAHRQQRRVRIVGRLRGNDLYWVRSMQILMDS
jgi:hypothetical protein